MQPYFLPYLGYWQLLSAVDLFVVYDNIQFTKKGWFNRNYMLSKGQKYLFSLPLKKDSDFLNVDHRCLADDSHVLTEKTLRVIAESYKKAPFFEQTFPLIQDVFRFTDKNLFRYIKHSIDRIAAHLSIDTQIIISSDIDIDHTLRAEAKVIALCKKLNAKDYINPIGGLTLYAPEQFRQNGIQLSFLNTLCPPYVQMSPEFVSHLSILDLLMQVGVEGVSGMLKSFEYVYSEKLCL
jgi:hypothetical protein